MSEKIYTQEDMDNITSKVKEKQQAKYEKTHISLVEYEKLKNQYEELVSQNKINEFKETFKANGGNVDAYNDFIASNKDIMELNGDDLTKRFGELKESKPYFFETKSTPVVNQQPTPNDNEVLKDLFGSEGDDLIPGTIYKKTI